MTHFIKWYLIIVAIVIGFALISGFLQTRLRKRYPKKPVSANGDLVAMGIQLLLAVAGFLYILSLHVTGHLWFDLAFAIMTGSCMVYGAVRSFQRYLESKKELRNK
jgi:hypothetical protein